jgi:hypothetical protein
MPRMTNSTRPAFCWTGRLMYAERVCLHHLTSLFCLKMHILVVGEY